ncbi:MAG: type II toxin-antitoxin system Phd/YefM family antitoxin [Burkholderiales bacterium]
MDTVNIHHAKTHLSKLVEQASQGEEIIIAKAGKPMAKLVQLGAVRTLRKPGLLKGKIHVDDDFDRPLPTTVVAIFEGKKPR